MLKTKNNNFIKNALAVLVGAMLLGFLWRVRGTGGWGSSWGLLLCGLVFTMFIVLLKGERQKTEFGFLGLTAISFMLTVPSWGTLLHQITGVLYEKEFWFSGDDYVYISVFSGIVLMLSLGFGLATLFGIMLGRGYSEKQWKIKDFAAVLIAFYAVDLISKASISHYVLDLLQPEAADVFEKYLAAGGFDLTAHEAFLQHFNDLSWAKKIDGGRNYFSSIQAISSVFRSVAALLATRFIVKDKTAARTGFTVSCAFAFSITVADLFFFFGDGGYRMLGTSPFGETISVWAMWEYFTGFIAGGIITAFMLTLKPKTDLPELAFKKVPEKPKQVLNFILCFAGMVGIHIVRPVLERYKDTDYQIIATAIALVFALALIAFLNVKFGFNCKKLTQTQTYKTVFIFIVAYTIIAYLFIAAPVDQEYKSIACVHTILSIISSAVAVVWATFYKREATK